MRTIAVLGIASLFLATSAAGALAMGGQGGPSDAWGSPYALYAPQTFKAPAGWGPWSGRSDYEARAVGADCHGDRACERRAWRNLHGAPGVQ